LAQNQEVGEEEPVESPQGPPQEEVQEGAEV
jgi:hypothetical protein